MAKKLYKLNKANKVYQFNKRHKTRIPDILYWSPIVVIKMTTVVRYTI